MDSYFELPSKSPARLDIDHVTVRYGNEIVLDEVTFQIHHGARVAIVGPNGAGKTTLFKVIAGLTQPAGGQVRIHGRPLASHQDCVAYVPQKDEVDWRFPVNVEEVVMMGRYGRMRGLRQPKTTDWGIVRDSLEKLGIRDLAKKPIGDLSGGQQQRVFIARALAQEPHILLMDEPFSGVDITTQDTTLDFLESFRSQEMTILVSTHDLEMAGRRFEQVLLLNKKVIAFGAPPAVFSKDALRATFSGRVLFLDGAAIVDHCCPPEHEIDTLRTG